MSWLWHILRPIVMPILRLVLRIRVEGKHHVPRHGAAILASNHLSALDHVVLPAVTRRAIVNISKIEHFENPVKRWLFRGWGVIPLKRGSGDQAALDAAKGALRAGKLFCIYPEGTRSRDGKLHKGHTGVARLALEIGVPIIPVAMVGTFEAYPKGGKLKLFRKTAAFVGEPYDVSEFYGHHADREVCRAVTDEVMRRLAALSGQQYVHEYQYNPEVPTHAKPSSDASTNAATMTAPEAAEAGDTRTQGGAAAAKGGRKKAAAQGPKKSAKKAAKKSRAATKK
jgi:1-acyl-sn-glycerol-3-phosphate acyltransferase